MKRQNNSLIWFAILFLVLSYSCSSVNTLKKAIKIAEREWVNTYGVSALKLKPYNIFLQGDSVWTISGSLPISGWTVNENGDSTFTMHMGGVPVIKIRKYDGKVIDIYHTK
jgi:hypothetical protein